MFGRLSGVAAVLCASLALGGAAIAGAPPEFQVSNTPVVMDHVTIETSTPYQLVTSRLDDEVKRFDESYRRLLKESKIDELRVKLTQGLEPDGFMIHFVAEQGGLLALEGRRQQFRLLSMPNNTSFAPRQCAAPVLAPPKLAQEFLPTREDRS